MVARTLIDAEHDGPNGTAVVEADGQMILTARDPFSGGTATEFDVEVDPETAEQIADAAEEADRYDEGVINGQTWVADAPAIYEDGFVTLGTDLEEDLTTSAAEIRDAVEAFRDR